ncbi:MAG: LptF/LptG family permease [Bacteroidaceae bacterium]|nr:LptF/LptG family permease [Bacteroidaceae bacterium]
MKFPKFHIKKMDIFIIKAFLKNLMATFFICLFIFILQLLWRWIDDFIGKGLDVNIIAKFFVLGSMSLISKAFPLAILLAALMTFGNFGEKFELLAMKAAGIPLIRTILPLIICCTLFGGVSFYFQNYVTPLAQMNLLKMMYSIKQTSPESDIVEKIFYSKLDGYSIYVNSKNKETGVLYDVTIYDMSSGFEKTNILVSDSAVIKNTIDDKYMVLSMFSGEQFSNLEEQNINKKNTPYRRESFTRKDVVIETDGGFEIKDAEFVKNRADSKNMKKLATDIDSLKLSNDSIGLSNFRALKRSNYKDNLTFNKTDSTAMVKESVYSMDVDSIYNSATKKSKLMWKRDALRSITSLKNTYDINNRILHQLDKDLNKHQIFWWEKITLSLACVIFLLIGAPLGSIVRRGGLGYPIIISVATFILYYIFETSGSKMASEGVWKIWFGSWLSTMILAPLGLFFTYQANKDSGILKNDAIKNFFKKLFTIPDKRHITVKEVIIDTPDYEKCHTNLKEIYSIARLYKMNNKLKKLPSIKKVFFNREDDVLRDLDEKLENCIEELSNCRNSRVIARLNDIPILEVNQLLAPFKKRWMNTVMLLIPPINVIVYIRSIRFRIKLLIDLTKVETRIREIIKILKKEKLIDTNE